MSVCGDLDGVCEGDVAVVVVVTSTSTTTTDKHDHRTIPTARHSTTFIRSSTCTMPLSLTGSHLWVWVQAQRDRMGMLGGFMTTLGGCMSTIFLLIRTALAAPAMVISIPTITVAAATHRRRRRRRRRPT